MSPDARLMCGLSLVLIPSIVYGGLTILGVITKGEFGAPAPAQLQPLQIALFRAGHAHAGVLTLLNLFLQVAIEYASFSTKLVWSLRWGAFLGPILVSMGFFGLAYFPRSRAILYLGAFVVAVTTLVGGIGLILAGR